MTPIESLMPVDSDTEEETGCSTIFKLNWLLSTNKVACANIKAIKRILQIIRDNIMKVSLINLSNILDLRGAKNPLFLQ